MVIEAETSVIGMLGSAGDACDMFHMLVFGEILWL